MIVGANVAPEHRLEQRRQRAARVGADVRDRALRVGRVLAEARASSARGLVGDVEGGAAGAEALERGRELEQRVVADAGHGRVAGARRARVTREAERALLGARRRRRGGGRRRASPRRRPR